MAVETSAVQISINVVDGNSGETVAKVVQNINQLGAAGATTGQRMKQGMEEAGTGAMSAKEKVHLLTEEFGIRLPRAFRGIVAESKVAQAALGALGSAMIGLGAIQIGAMVFEQLYEGTKKLWENYLSLTAAAEAYQKQVDKAKDEDFINVRDIETATERIKEATSAAQGFQQTAQQMHQSLWSDIANGMLMGGPQGGLQAGIMDTYGARKMADAGYKKQGQVDAMTPKLASENHQAILDAIDLSYASDGRLRGEQKITAEKNKQHAINEENRKYMAAEEGMRGDKVSPDAGMSRQKTLDAIADQKANAESFNMERTTSNEIAHLRDEARQAELHGIALLEDKRKSADAEWTRQHGSSAEARKQIDAKYFSEEKRMLDDQRRETEKIERASGMAGLTGIAKVQAEGAAHVAEIDPHNELLPEERAKRVAAAGRDTTAEIGTVQKGFAEEVDRIVEQSQERELGGFARIQAEAQKAKDDLQKRFDTMHELMDLSAPGAQTLLDKDTDQFGRGLTAIDSGAGRQSSELSRKNAEETEQIESQARAKLMSAEKNQTAAIESEYEERLHKYNEELKQQEISQQDYDRRAVAAGQLRDAQLVDSARQAREKMASEYTSFFKGMDHPLKYLQDVGDKFAGEAAAAMTQRIQNHYGGKGASANEPLGGGSMLSGLFDRMAGHPKGVGSNHASTHPDLASSVSSLKAISLSTAEIHIQSANIGMGGVPSTAGGAGQTWSTSGGSTGLIASGSSGATGGVASGSSFRPVYSSSRGSGTVSSDASLGVDGGTDVSSMPSIMGFGHGGGSFSGSPTGGSSEAGLGGSSFASPQSSSGRDTGLGVGASGGAGDPESTSSGPVGTTGTPGIVPTHRNVFGTALNYVSQGIGFSKQAKADFGASKKTPASNTTDSSNPSASDGTGMGSGPHMVAGGVAGDSSTSIGDGSPSAASSASGDLSSASGTAGMASGAGKMQTAMSGAQGAIGVYSAFEGNGGVGGAMSGAMSGMELGMAVAGPVGAVVGAVGGAVLGAFGFGGREKARAYDLKQVRPRIANDNQSYQQGSMDYLSAYSDIQSLDMEAKKTTSSYGPAASSYYQDTMKKELREAGQKFTAEQKAGRSHFTATVAQGHQGGWTENFGSMATGPDTGWMHMRANEFVVNEQPAAEHAGALEAIRSGATHSDMAKYYGADSTKMPASSETGGDVHLHVHSLDTKSGMQWLMANKHVIRAAVNSSYAENSGGADA